MRGIAVFETAARSSSFQAAAEELNLTPSAVSHQVRLLEDIVGVRLFDRIGRRVALTPEGADYARLVRQSIRRLRAATSDLRARGKNGRSLDVVRLEMPPSFAHCWLLPRFAELMDELPGVEIRVNAQGGHLQGDRLPFPLMADAPADVQIVYGDKDIWEDRASLLLWESFQPYCAPAFRDRYALDEPGKLARRMLVRTAQNVVSWDEWFEACGIDLDDDPAGSVQMDPSHLAIRTAGNGVGVILESDILVGRDVADGTLVPLFPALSRRGVGYWIFTSPTHQLRPGVEAVIAWLRAKAEEQAPG